MVHVIEDGEPALAMTHKMTLAEAIEWYDHATERVIATGGAAICRVLHDAEIGFGRPASALLAQPSTDTRPIETIGGHEVEVFGHIVQDGEEVKVVPTQPSTDTPERGTERHTCPTCGSDTNLYERAEAEGENDGE